MQFNFQALGTHWWIEIWDQIEEHELKKIAHALYDITANFEKKFSRFQTTSLIAQLNQNRELNTLDAEFIEIIKYGQSLFKRTDGIFNMLTGNVLEVRGYGTISTTEKQKLDEKPGNPLKDIIFTNEGVQLLRHSHLDIGGFGKGWLIDKLAKHMTQEFQCQGFLINGGGDIYATHQNKNPVEIFKEDPNNTQKITNSIHIKNQGFAGSSPHKRTWKNYNAEGKTQIYNHIVTTPSSHLNDGAHVVANSAVEADAFATTLLQLDKTSAQALASRESFLIV